MAEPMGLGFSDLVFEEATPEQRRRSWELNSQTWASPLSQETYVLGQEEASRSPYCTDGSRWWALYLKGYPNQIVASCETQRKSLFLAQPNPGTIETEKARPTLYRAYGYSIASVFTNPAYHRRGMAAHLLRALQVRMDADPDAVCSVLYSDLGRSYYLDLGWRQFSSRQATFSLFSVPSSLRGPILVPKTCSLQHTSPERVRYLASFDELPPLCKADEAALATRLYQMTAADDRERLAFAPTSKQVMWHLNRAAFDAAHLFPGSPHQLRIGAVTADGAAWVYWSHEWRHKKLKVLRIVTRAAPQPASALASPAANHAPPTPPPSSTSTTPRTWHAPEQARVDVTRVLLEAAMVEAARWGLPKVVVWNPDEEATWGCKMAANAHAKDVELVFDERQETELPSLRWKGRASVKRLVWEDNQFYCWC